MSRLFVTSLLSGIYQIVDKTTGKLYVGSAVDLKRRKSQHFSLLRKGEHPNPQLQSVYNKQHQLEFFVIEYVPETELLNVEQMYLDILWDNGKRCFNAAKQVGNFSKPKFFDIFLLDPKKQLHGPILGLSSFARKHNLQKEHLSALIKGRLKTHKGWQVSDNLSKRPQSKRHKWDFISPEGKIYKEITNLTEFAETHKLKPSSLNKLAHKHRTSLFGWKLYLNNEGR